MKEISETYIAGFYIRKAKKQDVALILSFIRELAEYEKRLDQVTATVSQLEETLFGDHPNAEVVIGEYNNRPIGFAVFFHNYSTFLAKPGMYLEDLYIMPEFRGIGLGTAMLSYLATVALERKCGRFEWWVLDWNSPAIEFYKRIGAEPMSDWTIQRISGEALVKLAKNFNKE